jgi:hypothetical protein
VPQVAALAIRLCAGSHPELREAIRAEVRILMQQWFSHIQMDAPLNDQEAHAEATGREFDARNISTDNGCSEPEGTLRNQKCTTPSDDPADDKGQATFKHFQSDQSVLGGIYEEGKQAACHAGYDAKASHCIAERAERFISRFAAHMILHEAMMTSSGYIFKVQRRYISVLLSLCTPFYDTLRCCLVCSSDMVWAGLQWSTSKCRSNIACYGACCAGSKLGIQPSNAAVND